MHKRITLIISIIFISSSIIPAQPALSAGYYMIQPKIISSSGNASSANYSFKGVLIGDLFGGITRSANYSLYTGIDIEIETKPSPPTLEPVKTPTNVTTQLLRGTKDADTAIYINGYEAAPLDNQSTWSFEYTLTEGDNELLITAKNAAGLQSDAVFTTIHLDTIAPVITINSPVDGVLISNNPITVTWSSDGIPYKREETLVFGPNTITISEEDNAGNSSQKSIEVYLIRRPISLP